MNSLQSCVGLKCRQQEYYTMLTTLADDLEILKKDPRCSFTKVNIKLWNFLQLPS